MTRSLVYDDERYLTATDMSIIWDPLVYPGAIPRGFYKSFNWLRAGEAAQWVGDHHDIWILVRDVCGKLQIDRGQRIFKGVRSSRPDRLSVQ